MLFEWDDIKRFANLDKHGIDFLRAKEIWQGDVIEVPSLQSHHGEPRWIAYGVLDGHVIAVVFTWRGQVRRLISARRARDYERKHYTDTFGRGA